MFKIRFIFALLALCCGALVSACQNKGVKRVEYVHAVTVERVAPLARALNATLVGRVYLHHGRLTDAGTLEGGSDYRVMLDIPAGAQAAVGKGQSLRVTLPIVHHQDTQGTVESVRPGQVELLLAKQVQELNGQEVRVEVPLRPNGIFRVPFDSIYSPRGLSKKVFVLKDSHVEARDVKVIALAGPEDILVSGRLEPGDRVVKQGLDNLLSGDTVQVVAAEEGNR